MKTDLVTSIAAAAVGIIAAYFICNMVLPPLSDVTIKTLDSGTTYTLTSPDPEVFNYRSINPTVEVYVGQCAEYNQYGECIENIEYVENEDVVIEDENTDTEAEENKQDTENQEDQPEVNEETQNGASN